MIVDIVVAAAGSNDVPIIPHPDEFILFSL